MSQYRTPPVILRGQTLSFDGNPFKQDPISTLRHESDGAVMLEGGRIIAAGPATDVIKANPGYDVTHYGDDSLIMAGFVDTHMHYPQTDIVASYGEQLLEWLERYTFPEEQRYGDPAYARLMADVFLDQCLSNGTTSASVYATVHPESADAFFEAASARNLRMACGKVCMDRNAPDGLMDTAQSAYDQSAALIKSWHGKGRNTYAITPRFAPTSTPEQLEALGALWQEHPTALMQTHISENADEIKWVAELFDDLPDYFGVYDAFGLTGPGSIFGHAIHLTDRERAAMTASGSAIAHCPTSNAFLGSGVFNIAANRGTPLGLASDVGGGPDFSMFATMRAAAEAASFHGNSLHPAQAFWLATIGGAEVLRMDDRVGNLDIGKEADLIVIDLKSTDQLTRRIGRATSLEDVLFAQMILADDRAIRETWIGGLCQYQAAAD
jgi:guanine deaminase